MMKTIFCIAILFSPQALWGGEQIDAKEKLDKPAPGLQIEGRIVDYINYAFSDYQKHNDYAISRSASLREIKYYKFTVREEGDSIFVGVGFNGKLVREELNLVFKGGSSLYEIDKKQFVIKNVLHFK